jgi:hypothetical protein
MINSICQRSGFNSRPAQNAVRERGAGGGCGTRWQFTFEGGGVESQQWRVLQQHCADTHQDRSCGHDCGNPVAVSQPISARPAFKTFSAWRNTSSKDNMKLSPGHSNSSAAYHEAHLLIEVGPVFLFHTPRNSKEKNMSAFVEVTDEFDRERGGERCRKNDFASGTP